MRGRPQKTKGIPCSEMKIRASKEWLERTRAHAEWIGVTRADLIRRCLRRWIRGGCVEVGDFGETATRENSAPIEVDLPESLVGDFHDRLTGRGVVAVVNAELAEVEYRYDPPLKVDPKDAGLEEGKDYVVAKE